MHDARSSATDAQQDAVIKDTLRRLAGLEGGAQVVVEDIEKLRLQLQQLQARVLELQTRVAALEGRSGGK